MVSNGQVKVANTKFQRVKNDFCIVFDKNTEITEVPDDQSINNVGYSFVSIKEFATMPNNTYVDTVGIVSNISPKT